MKNRRYFLIQSTLATTAMFALKPLTGIGQSISQFPGFSNSYGKLTFVHTANISSSNSGQVLKFIHGIKNNNRNAIVLNVGQAMPDEHSSLIFDASINGGNDISAVTAEYKIIDRGNIRTGIISAKPGENNIIRKMKTVSSWLKKEKNCTIVVCLSQLGYKNENAPDDITLAKDSTDIDIIVGGHPENFHKHPIVALNSNNAEVIIHAASGNSLDCGKIEIGFDWQGEKNQISFMDHSSQNIVSNRTTPAA